jgi:hypothetical protein
VVLFLNKTEETMKKMLVALSLIVLAANGALEARGGGHGGGHRGGGHGGRSWGHGGRGWGGRGYYGGRGWGGWGGGWGWGPAFGVGLSVPLGGPSYEAPQPVVIQQPVAVTSTTQVDPYNRYMSLFGVDPVKNRKSYRRWLFDNYSSAEAQQYYNYFLVTYYNPYQASKPTASLSIGTGVGFGGGYYGGPYYGRGWRRW